MLENSFSYLKKLFIRLQKTLGVDINLGLFPVISLLENHWYTEDCQVPLNRLGLIPFKPFSTL